MFISYRKFLKLSCFLSALKYITKMTKRFVDCFMLMGTALSLRGGQKLQEMGRPLLQDVITTTVNLSLSLQEVKILSNNNLEVEVTALMNQKWMDPRLGANLNTRKMAVLGQIWKPKIVNINGENQICHNEDTVFWRGFGEEGRVLLSEKIDVKTTCTKDYHKFPFDTQICVFKFGTFRFPEDEVTIVWDTIPVYINTGLRFNDFNVTNITTYVEMETRPSGNFSTVVIQFAFKRHAEHYFYCIIFPSLFLTLVNYAPFWFNLNKRSIRLYINMSVFGFMFYLYYISLCLSYSASYLKAIDVFVIICQLFSFITLLETVFVHAACSAEELNFYSKKLACSKEHANWVFWIEFAMKLSYPVFFIFFIIVYFWIYL